MAGYETRIDRLEAGPPDDFSPDLEGRDGGEPLREGRDSGAAGALFERIRAAFPPIHRPTWVLFDEICPGLLPSALGGARLDLRRPQGIFATRLAGPGLVRWRSERFAESSDGVRLLAISAGGWGEGAVRFDARSSEIGVEVEALPEDGRWGLFCLVRGDLFRSDTSRREVFALARSASDGRAEGSPTELLGRRCLVEAWAAADREGWTDRALQALLLLIFPMMDLLIDEAVPALELTGPSHDFLRDDLESVRTRSAIASMQQALIDDFDA